MSVSPAAFYPNITLAEGSLFGNVKNYPNAGSPERPGLIGEADGATLLLDEIGELPEEQQAHLLRVLDADGEYQRLGESRPRRSRFCLVGATNRGFDALKHDFVARFPLRIQVSGLNDRRADIPLLARVLIERACAEREDWQRRFFERRNDTPAEPRLQPALIERLVRHRYTTRELERLLLQAIATSSEDCIGLGEALIADLDESSGGNDDSARPAERVPERGGSPRARSVEPFRALPPDAPPGHRRERNLTRARGPTYRRRARVPARTIHARRPGSRPDRGWGRRAGSGNRSHHRNTTKGGAVYALAARLGRRDLQPVDPHGKRRGAPATQTSFAHIAA